MQPVNYDMLYYQGNSITLTVWPKDSTGEAIPILPTDTPFFNIANERGENPATSIAATSQILDPNGGGVYALVGNISSAVGDDIENGFVYDLGYIKDSARVTVLTGTFRVTERVFGP